MLPKEAGGDLGVYQWIRESPGRGDPWVLPVPVKLQRPDIHAQLMVLQRRHERGKHRFTVGIETRLPGNVQRPGPRPKITIAHAPGLRQRHGIQNVPGHTDIIGHLVVGAVRR